ncbi:hypothetical protein LX32DRAFT_718375 [Colletotrichum zoysiae]|uniref:Biotrophy-associated secreted protein 3 n=1 Tax=Colletotrichum zoysiae TaxID=1216348 RepID=A0AAD9HIM1_9PEZI|nr:hypothetical protein LX32DRAFT_718375 [Colletotrichum zoysiae]
MYLTTILFTLLPVLATAFKLPSIPGIDSPQPSKAASPPSPPPAIQFSNNACNVTDLIACPKEFTGIAGCISINGEPRCLKDCPSGSTCPTECLKQGHINGVCGDSNNPCICTDERTTGLTT